jgi:hypothetical protein
VYTRREFGKMTLAGLPVSLALGRIDSQVEGVRIGVQSYSFRTLPLDAAIKAMSDIGIGECELFAGHVEPRPSFDPRRPKAAGPPATKRESAEAGGGPARNGQEELRNWRLTVPMDHFKAIRRKFDHAGIRLHAYNLSFNDRFSDEEIDRGFEMAKSLGVEIITASSTLSTAKRVAPFADKHKRRFFICSKARSTISLRTSSSNIGARTLWPKSASASNIARTRFRSWRGPRFASLISVGVPRPFRTDRVLE